MSVAAAFGDGQHSGSGVGTREGGQYRGVRDAQPVDTVYSQLRVDDCCRVGAYPAGANRMMVGVYVAAEVVAQIGCFLDVGPGSVSWARQLSKH